jgi:hypothetical protein
VSDNDETVGLKAKLTNYEAALQAVISARPNECTHGEEPDYCPSCDHEWDVRLAAATKRCADALSGGTQALDEHDAVKDDEIARLTGERDRQYEYNIECIGNIAERDTEIARLREKLNTCNVCISSIGEIMGGLVMSPHGLPAMVQTTVNQQREVLALFHAEIVRLKQELEQAKVTARREVLLKAADDLTNVIPPSDGDAHRGLQIARILLRELADTPSEKGAPTSVCPGCGVYTDLHNNPQGQHVRGCGEKGGE